MMFTDELTARNPNLRYGYHLLEEAKTFRWRVFARLITHAIRDDTGGRRLQHKALPTGLHTFTLPPGELTLSALIEDTTKSPHRQEFEAIPFVSRSRIVDPELPEWLQDLAELIAYEATEAFRASFYPGVADVEPLSEEHVTSVMTALQREMDREGKRRGKTPGRYLDLPPERQQALAERRRWWYGKFGITPQTWPRGTFSLWDVTDERPPEWLMP